MWRKALLPAVGLVVCVSLWGVSAARPGPPAAKAPGPVEQRLAGLTEAHQFSAESLERKIDEEVLFRRLADLAEVDKEIGRAHV